MKKGEVTAFLSLIFILLVAFIGGIMESASVQMAKNYRRTDMNRAMEAVFAEYQKELLEEYDILIMGVFSKLTADMIEYIKKPKIIATLSVGLDHIDNIFFESPLVEVVNIKLANTVSVAEHIFSLMKFILCLNTNTVLNFFTSCGKEQESTVHA